MAASEDKTEKATPKRRKEARKEGQVARTPELGAWGTLLILSMFGPRMVESELHRWTVLMARSARFSADPSTRGALQFLEDAGFQTVRSIVVLGLIVMLIGVVATVAQGGFFLAPKAMKPSLKKFDPVAGFKRMLGPQAWWNAVKMILKASVVALVVYHVVRSMVPYLGRIMPIDSTLEMADSHIISLVRWAAAVGVLLAAADYAMAWRRTSKQTKMSKYEVKQEHKQAEGDPMVKSAIRSRQLQAARNRMMQAVPEADVVMVNPTHVAVALVYVPGSGAPRVTARGAGEIARKIRELARDNDVPLVHDVPLTRALYRSTQVGQEIPAELFGAVAQVLAFVISRRVHGYWGGDLPTPRREEVPDVAPSRKGRRRRTAGYHRGGGGTSAVDGVGGM